jgi:Ubiquitin-like autophagy protein Apg12
VPESDPFLKIFTYLRSPKLLNLGSKDAPLFLYLKQAFSPQPTEKVGTLADAFGYVDNGNKTLVVQYAITPAWG